MMKLGRRRCTVQKSRPSSNFGVIALPPGVHPQNVALSYAVGKRSACYLVKLRIHFITAALIGNLQSGLPSYISSLVNFSIRCIPLRRSSLNFLHVSVLSLVTMLSGSQLQQFGILSCTTSPSVQSQSPLFSLPGLVDTSQSHRAVLVPITRACLNLCTLQIL